MKVVKTLLLVLLTVVLALGAGAGIYMIQYTYFNDHEEGIEIPEATVEVTAQPTEEPDLTQYIITIDKVNIRKEPTTDAEIVGKVEKDTVLQLLYSDTEWSTISYSGEKAYVNNEFVKSYELSASQNTNGKIIVIDAGCQSVSNIETEPIGPEAAVVKNKADAGYTGIVSGKKEYELNLELAVKLKAALEAKGYQIIMTRESNDANISNSDRAKLANDSAASLLISIRANASLDSNEKGVVGICQTINNPYNSANYNNSYKLANALSNEVCIATGAVNGGLWQTDTVSVINWSKVPAALLQVGYLTNAEEEQNLINEEYQNKIVDGIVNGLEAYFGL